ncbi:unnamed protein product [Prorocentrum cordatum]|uniref:Mei2-like C-terminal RNA recognition motif domain-containing protein n=1 Tax=Prorocentrum cordatum TaxID=2364126 RepID=A0ABN9T2B4_9DINO|nr:unnamed protein product [Polarella glacialis]
MFVGDQVARRAELDGKKCDSEAVACESAACESTVVTYPDTESEFGDYSGTCDTRRDSAGEQQEPRVADGAAQQPQPSQGSEQGRKCRGRGRKKRVAQANKIKEMTSTSGPHSITTVMVRNVPERCQQDEFVSELDKSGFQGMYDFCYMPRDFKSSLNKGYVFLNFKTPTAARCFKNMWHGWQRFSNHPDSDSRRLQVTAAHIQGFEANIAMLETAGTIRNPNYRRLVISNSDPDRGSLEQSSPAAQPAARLPATPPQISGLAEGAGPQTALSKPPGEFLSASAGACPQVSASEYHFEQHPNSVTYLPFGSCQWTDLARQQGTQLFPWPAMGQWGHPAL